MILPSDNGKAQSSGKSSEVLVWVAMDESKLPTGEAWIFPTVSVHQLGPFRFRKMHISPPPPPVSANQEAKSKSPGKPKKFNNEQKGEQVLVDDKRTKAINMAKKYNLDNEDDVFEEDVVFREPAADALLLEE